MNKEIISELSEYIPTIYSCIKEGFKDAIMFIEKGNRLLGKTTKSNIINDYIVLKVREKFPPETILKNGNRLKALLLKGTIIRFKKLNGKHLAGNIPTGQATNYAWQRKLPGVKTSLHLNAGWVLDETSRNIVEIYLTCPQSLSENRWVLSLTSYVANENAIFETQLTKFAQESAEIEYIPALAKPKAKKDRERKKAENE